MYLGKTLFAQIMDFLPWKTFHRIVDRYSGDYSTSETTTGGQPIGHSLWMHLWMSLLINCGYWRFKTHLQPTKALIHWDFYAASGVQEGEPGVKAKAAAGHPSRIACNRRFDRANNNGRSNSR